MALMRRPVSLIVIAALALAQGVLGVLLAFEWFQVVTDLHGRGGIVLPFILPVLNLVAVGRGAFVAVIALLYCLFALGALARQRWAWGIGLVAALVSGLALVSLVIIEEEFLTRALPWAVVPVVLASYLLAPAGRRALGH